MVEVEQTTPPLNQDALSPTSDTSPQLEIRVVISIDALELLVDPRHHLQPGNALWQLQALDSTSVKLPFRAQSDYLGSCVPHRRVDLQSISPDMCLLMAK